MANQVIFVNQPDINKIMRNLCEVANRDCKGEYEYTYTLKEPKEENKNA